MNKTRPNLSLRPHLLVAAILLLAIPSAPGESKTCPLAQGVFNVRDFGAKGDGKALDTAAIQKAIDSAHAAGGGTVYLQGGVFHSGTIILKSNVTLYLEAGAKLLGSRDMAHYPDIDPEIPYLYSTRFTKYMIYAEKAENISIAGRGTIDGQGEFYEEPKGDKLRPYIVRFAECRNVRVTGVTFLNSARWLSHYLACEDVVIDGIKIHSRKRENRDGIDIDSCRHVRISNSHIFAGDDAIVLKATAKRMCEDVTVTNCILSSEASAFKLGTESNGGFRDITCTNCTIYDTGYSGIGLMMVDGASLERVNVSNIVMKNVEAAIFIRLGNRARPMPEEEPPGMGSLRDVSISNIIAGDVGPTGCSITGIPGHYAENITLRNIRLRFRGGGDKELATREVPERETSYPSGRMFGELPAYGFFLRHVKNVRMDGIDLDWEENDARPAVIGEDVIDLNLSGLRAAVAPEAKSAVWLKDVNGAFVHGCSAPASGRPLLEIEGKATRDVTVTGNEARKSKNPVVISGDVPEGAVVVD